MTNPPNAAQNPHGKSALQQGSSVPAKWRPTPSEPVPVVRCTAIKKNGERCGSWSLRGATVCVRHGGRLPNVQDHAAAVVEAARIRIVGLSDMAVDTIEDLARNGTAEKIRLDAARDLLDRAGVKGAIDINVEVQQTTNPADELRARLAEAAARLTPKVQNMQDAAEEEIQDAEIVDEETGE